MNQEQDDMRAYESTPGLILPTQQSNPFPPQFMPPSPQDGEWDFSKDEGGISNSSQMLEAVLAELRAIHQTIRELR